MSRVKYGPASRARRKRVSKMAKGYRASRSKLHRVTVETVKKALMYGTRDRRAKKGTFRRLWILRISNACKELGISYSRFMKGLKDAKIGLNRKILADMVVNDMAAFKKLVAGVQKK
ncbi:MAG: 50S ribosomal protein L20 [Candidatus Omnitrophica bacterium CG_4_9_14_0_2_um_filter_42_8]|nr:MAG: 50S ribosomal protein L20 [Candidatus Omnitrophica bacterium CG22_combo_CG10-13_8_21_14_all_43_16]PJC49075.1 MAG: 50S ribosomal protein L20 [Candidatus Omnitrophica bacterium CG_4_9_14_0_2_um_filter_42_8]